MRYLNYSADVRHMAGEIVGPDRFGALYRAMTAEPRTDIAGGTWVGFRPITGDELEAVQLGGPLPPLDARPTLAVR